MRHIAITFKDMKVLFRIVLIMHVQIYTGKQHLPTIYIDNKDSYEIMPNLSENLILSQWEKLVFLRAALLYTAGSKNTSGVLQDMVA